MKLLSFCSCFVVAAAFIVGCDEDDSMTGLEEVDYQYIQFVHFDSTEYRFVKKDEPGLFRKIPEPIVNWEQSLGEPFTDRNDNGVYEPGIDTFIVSPDPAINQDLNGNGQYDSPDDPWSEGIPFDDIDGNGVFRPDSGDHTTGYELGLPYADYNTNRKHDGDLKASYGVGSWITGVWYTTGTSYLLVREEAAVYRFVSDSGLNYDLYLSHNPIIRKLYYSDTALYYGARLIDGNNYEYYVKLLNSGIIQEEDSTRVEIPQFPDPLIVYRWVTLDQQLVVDGIRFSNLAKVRIGNDLYRYDFYFSRNLGLLAYERWKDLTDPPDNWLVYRNDREYYFRSFDGGDSLILPATR